jgi:hypothetical protein
VSGGAGAGVVRDDRGRRVREVDRYGVEQARLAWGAGGGLAEAAVRLPDASWLTIVPGAADDPRWGASDLLRHEGRALTHCAAIDWARVDGIPPLAEPARLPPGAGSATLNLVAALAADQQRGPLTYRGPYPTEQLFLALLESFRWQPQPTDAEAGREIEPLAAFMAGGLRWAPAPHTRALAPAGVFVQRRARVEKVVWEGRAYYRADWQGVVRHATHRLVDSGGRVHGVLWALGAPLEHHVVLAPDGEVLRAALPPPDDEPPRALAAAVADGVVAVVVAASAPPLAATLRDVGGELAFEWAPLAGELAALDGRRARLSVRLRRALAARGRTAGGRAEQVRLGFAALAELAAALGDGLRARAQARLAGAPASAQAAALGRERAPAEAAARAREIGVAVEALLEDVAQPVA